MKDEESDGEGTEEEMSDDETGDRARRGQRATTETVETQQHTQHQREWIDRHRGGEPGISNVRPEGP